jgi:hypothetical protein
MAWHSGNFKLSPGSSGGYNYWRGDDHGVQYSEPIQLISNEPPPVVANTLRVTGYGTIRKKFHTLGYLKKAVFKFDNNARIYL